MVEHIKQALILWRLKQGISTFELLSNMAIITAILVVIVAIIVHYDESIWSYTSILFILLAGIIMYSGRMDNHDVYVLQTAPIAKVVTANNSQNALITLKNGETCSVKKSDLHIEITKDTSSATYKITKYRPEVSKKLQKSLQKENPNLWFWPDHVTPRPQPKAIVKITPKQVQNNIWEFQ